jgi:hypothetical protein
MTVIRRIRWGGWTEPEYLVEFEEDSKEGEADGVQEWR